MGMKIILTCDKCGAILVLPGPYDILEGGKMDEVGWRHINAGTIEEPKWRILCRNCWRK